MTLDLSLSQGVVYYIRVHPATTTYTLPVVAISGWITANDLGVVAVVAQPVNAMVLT